MNDSNTEFAIEESIFGKSNSSICNKKLHVLVPMFRFILQLRTAMMQLLKKLHQMKNQ